MKHTFVLDENVIVLAAEVENEEGQHDTSCLVLLTNISDNNHALAINTEWEQKFQRKISRLHSRTSLAFAVQKLVNMLSRDSERYVRVEQTLDVDMADCVKDDDRWIVQLACTVQDVFATTDSPLIDCLTTSSMTDKYRFKAVRPEDALAFAMESGT